MKEQIKEKILQELYSHYVIVDTIGKGTDGFMESISQLLEEARKEERAKIKKYIDDNRAIYSSNDIFSVRCEKEATNSTLDDLEYFISSL